MWSRWKLFGFHLYKVLYFVLMLCLNSDRCSSLSHEGLALMGFRFKVEKDPHGIFENWNPEDSFPCQWRGVHCVDGKVEILNLSRMSLGGELAPDLGKLSHLRALVLDNNDFYGVIPKEIGRLTKLEFLDLRSNNLTGTIPAEIGEMLSLKHLWVDNNKLEGFLELHLFENDKLSGSPFRRKLLVTTTNLPANPVADAPILDTVDVPSTGSGSFPAIPNADDKKKPSLEPTEDAGSTDQPSTPSAEKKSTDSASGKTMGKWGYILMILAAVLLLVLVAGMLLMGRSRSVATIGPWKTGISGQLQKAFVAGVPKLNRSELEAACEDFSNIIQTYPEFTLYKGTLSSGVEIAVVSTIVRSSQDWPERSEKYFRERIDTLSRINHKNFVNLLGYCEEDEPFLRMMVFEYAPSGSLFEHLHVKELEHLDWSARMRIIMGIAYCLQYMHHDLQPAVAHTNLQSSSVFLTDDFAAKIMEFDFWKEFARGKVPGDEETDITDVPLADPPSNVFSFGVLLLEIVSGKLPYSKEEGSIINWAAAYLNDKRTMNNLIDPSLKSAKDNELEIVCEVIQECITPDPKRRPTMKDVTTRLKDVLAISPESATPRLSPLWWAELEILSVEAS